MTKLFFYLLFISLAVMINSCSKKVHPSETVQATGIKSSDSAAVIKKTIKTRPAVPTVIIVNDKAAKISVDGRYYYDLDGHRYWRNNKDGRYYLYNKSMYKDPAFNKQE